MSKRTLLVISSLAAVVVLLGGGFLLYPYYLMAQLSEKLGVREEAYKESLTPEAIATTAAAIQLIERTYPELVAGNLNDAGPYLNPVIPVTWNVPETHKAEFDDWHKPWPAVSDATSEAVAEIDYRQPFDDSPLRKIPVSTAADEVAYAQLDATWFDEIQKYDHWNLEENSPLGWMPVGEYAQVGWAINSLEFFEVVTVTLLKQYIQHRDAGQIDAFRHKSSKLASLLLSTEDLFFAILAESVLVTSARLVADGEEVDVGPVEDVMSSVIQNVNNMVHPLALSDPKVRELLRTRSPLVCVGLHEGLRLAEVVYSFAGRRSDFFYEQLDPLFREQIGSCRFSRLRNYWGVLPPQSAGSIANALRQDMPGLIPIWSFWAMSSRLERFFWSYLKAGLSPALYANH